MSIFVSINLLLSFSFFGVHTFHIHRSLELLRNILSQHLVEHTIAQTFLTKLDDLIGILEKSSSLQIQILGFNVIEKSLQLIDDWEDYADLVQRILEMSILRISGGSSDDQITCICFSILSTISMEVNACMLFHIYIRF